MAETITPEELQNRLETGEPVFVLDVRHPEEFETGHIDGATLVPLDDFSALPSLPKDKTIVCVCRSGNRSNFAAEFLSCNGYVAKNLVGGMISWYAHQRSLGRISAEEFRRMMDVLDA
ncbi:rhodanese-like domain-containing protein [Candidatus Woesearchaeota archaeon]|nr:rhodanese-like domain-containing protein [Candidatus Woesearchaeota archaeon]